MNSWNPTPREKAELILKVRAGTDDGRRSCAAAEDQPQDLLQMGATGAGGACSRASASGARGVRPATRMGKRRHSGAGFRNWSGS